MIEPPRGRRGWWLLLAFALPLAGVLLLYRPAVGFELMGDDYQWRQHTHAAMHRPLLLLADLDTFYRPASTWTLAADRLLLGDRPAGFHLTNLLLHALAGALLVLAGRRLGLPPPESAAVGLLWALSPFSEEPAVSVAIRFQDLLLLSWLGLVLAWPRDGVWTRGRVFFAGLCTLFAAASKETWVMTPALVVAMEAAWGRRRLADWIRRAAPFVAAALLEWTIHREAVLFKRIPERQVEGVPGDVLVHRRGGFTWAARGVPDLAAEARRWRESGLHLRLVRAVALPSS